MLIPDIFIFSVNGNILLILEDTTCIDSGAFTIATLLPSTIATPKSQAKEIVLLMATFESQSDTSFVHLLSKQRPADTAWLLQTCCEPERILWAILTEVKGDNKHPGTAGRCFSVLTLANKQFWCFWIVTISTMQLLQALPKFNISCQPHFTSLWWSRLPGKYTQRYNYPGSTCYCAACQDAPRLN